MTAKIIKLENIQPKDGMEQPTEEYVCESCRHLVEPTDKVCLQCGEKLEQSNLVEHYYKGEKLTDEEYQKRRVSK